MTRVATMNDDSSMRREGSVQSLARFTVRLLRGVERLPAGATGAFVFGERNAEPTGMILVENGRICWAATPGMERRLTDILVSQSRPPLSYAVVEDVYERCRRDGTPLGAGLVARGIVTPRGLRQALLQHAGEAIAGLSESLQREGRVAPTWVPNRARRYDAQFTFTPAEILAAVGSRVDDGAGMTSRATLEQTLPDAAVGAAFLGRSDRLPVAELRGDRLGVEGLVELGAWAQAVVARSSRFTSPGLIAAIGLTRAGAVTWEFESILYVALCDEGSEISHLISMKARSRQKRVE